MKQYRINRLIGVFLCLCFSLLAAQAQQISFLKCSWEELKKQAQEKDKPIFVDIYTSWCGPCKKMSATVFKDPQVVAFINKNYIAIKLDAEKEKNHGFFSHFQPGAYPSFYWLDKHGQLLSMKTGYLPSEQFIQSSKEALTGSLGKRLEECKQMWEAGNRKEDFIEKYLFDVLPQVNPKSIRPLFNEYLSGLNDEQLKSLRIGKWVSRFTSSIVDDKVWTTLLANNDVYASELSETIDLRRYLYMNLVRIPMAERKDSTKLSYYLNLIQSKSFPNKEMYLSLLEMENKIFEGHFAEALKDALEIGAKYENKHPYLYREMAYTFIIGKFFLDSYTPSAQEMKDIVTLTEKGFQLTPCQSTVSYLAAAYARGGEYKKAYEMLAILPFQKQPTLSNAVYSLLNLPRRR